MILKIKNLGDFLTCPNYADENGTVHLRHTAVGLPFEGTTFEGTVGDSENIYIVKIFVVLRWLNGQ